MVVVYEHLGRNAEEWLSPIKIGDLLTASSTPDSSPEEKYRLLGETALKSLPEEKANEVLAVAANHFLTSKQIQAAFRKETAKLPDPPDEEIDLMLSKAVETALSQIAERKYHMILDSHTKKVIDLGLAVYGYGQRLKAAFGPEDPPDTDKT